MNPWTEEVNSSLVELWRDHSAAVIAAKIYEQHGVRFTRNAILGRAHRIGLSEADKNTEYKVARIARERPSKPKRKPKLRVVAAGDRGGIRLMWSNTSDPAEVRCVEIEPLNVALGDLTASHCRYPYGNGPFSFCGHQKMDGSSYCEAHTALCWVPARARAAA